MGVKGKNRKEKQDNITNLKKNTPFEELLEGCPIEFVKYLKYNRALQYDQKPDYTYLKKLFEGFLHKNGWEEDFEYDWVIKKDQKIKELNPNAVEEEPLSKEIEGKG